MRALRACVRDCLTRSQLRLEVIIRFQLQLWNSSAAAPPPPLPSLHSASSSWFLTLFPHLTALTQVWRLDSTKRRSIFATQPQIKAIVVVGHLSTPFQLRLGFKIMDLLIGISDLDIYIFIYFFRLRKMFWILFIWSLKRQTEHEQLE